MKEAFRTTADKLPAYAGVENNQGGFTLVKVSKLVDTGPLEEGRKQAYAQRFSSMLEREYAAAYLASLKQKTKVEIRKEALEKTER